MEPPPQPPGRLSQLVRAELGGLPRQFWFLWLGTLLNRLGTFVVPFLAIYLKQELKLSLGWSGVVVALFGAGSILGMQVGGALADRLGRKPTQLLGLVLGAASLLGLGLSTTPTAVASLAFLFGLTSDLYRPAVMAMLVDVVAPKDRQRAFGLLYWAINLGAAVAPVIAGQLAHLGFFTLFAGDAATSLLFAALVALLLAESRPQTAEARPALTLQSQLAPWTDRIFLPFLLANLGVTFIFAQHLVALPVDTAAFGVSTEAYGGIIGLNGLMIVLFQPFTTRALQGQRRGIVLATGAALTGAGFALTALARGSVSIYLASVAVWTAGEIIMAPVNSSVVADLAPPQLRGRYQGAYGTTWSLSLLLGPAVGTGLYAHSPQLLWATCGVLGGMAAAAHLASAPARRVRMRELGIAARD